METQVKDPFNGLAVRATDNGLKDCDLEAPQDREPLDLVDGKPEGWEAPNGDC